MDSFPNMDSESSGKLLRKEKCTMVNCCFCSVIETELQVAKLCLLLTRIVLLYVDVVLEIQLYLVPVSIRHRLFSCTHPISSLICLFCLND